MPFALSDTRDANETRERLRDVMSQYPPTVREVLRIDTSLLSRPDYLATYPMLAAFLEQHPEVAHNPAFFIGESRYQEANRNDPRAEAYRALNQMGEHFLIAFIVITITTGLVYLIRTLAEQIRWQRAWRAQSTLNTKLIDRFSSSEELLAYLQSPAGRGLTELPALPQASVYRGMTAPLGRIFWSMQAGTVLVAGGIGLLFISNKIAVSEPEVQTTFFALGTFVLMIGGGFVVSSGISYFLSQRLGLIQPVTPRVSNEAPGS